MSAEDVYGFADPELEALRVQVEAALGLALAARYSSYHGGNYYLGKAPPQTRITLQRNFDEREREWALEGFPDSKALLFVGGAPTSVAVDAASARRSLTKWPVCDACGANRSTRTRRRC